jgi:hypothetical protein
MKPFYPIFMSIPFSDADAFQIPPSPAGAPARDQRVLTDVQHWLTRAVIGLNLCPFAKSVYVHDQIRYVVSHAGDASEALAQVRSEMLHLAQVDPGKIETTLVIVPNALGDFLDYNDALNAAEKLLKSLRLRGILQIASFHPAYQFEGTDADDIENYTNRSPYPIFHLLREESVERAVDAFPDTAAIYERNQQCLREMGLAGWNAWMKQDDRNIE